MIKRSLLLPALLFFTQVLMAQTKQTNHLGQVWTAYFNQTRFSNKWGIWADVHLRTREDVFSHFSTAITRVGLTYYLNDNTKLTAGYSFINHYPANGKITVSQPEHRPWQQIQWHTKYSRIRTMQYLRLEERFRRKYLNNTALDDGYNFNYKLRYNFFLQAPLSKKGLVPKTLSLVLNDEAHVNFGKEIVYNYFDQNRFFLGFNYAINADNNLQFGYMNVFTQLAAGNQYRNVHAARLFYTHNLDLRTRK